MALIPGEALPFFENMIYLPMIIQVLERDREVIETSAFKLKGPYINIVESALNIVRAELKEFNVEVDITINAQKQYEIVTGIVTEVDGQQGRLSLQVGYDSIKINMNNIVSVK